MPDKKIFQKVTAFCPGHISGFFKPHINQDPERSGSTGGGIVINEGVTVIVSPADKTSICIQREIHGEYHTEYNHSPVLEDLIHHLHVSVRVTTRTRLPLSSGYGLSAASLLALTHGINILFNLGLSDHECAVHAHRVEVIHHTGLGDVAACQDGGWVYRSRPGISPEIVRNTDPRSICALTICPLKTSSVLSSPDLITRISRAFPREIPSNLDELMLASRYFAERSGLIGEPVREVLTFCDEQHILASMTMLGNGVFALGKESEDILSRFGRVYHLHIAEHGPRIMEAVI